MYVCNLDLFSQFVWNRWFNLDGVLFILISRDFSKYYTLVVNNKFDILTVLD